MAWRIYNDIQGFYTLQLKSAYLAVTISSSINIHFLSSHFNTNAVVLSTLLILAKALTTTLLKPMHAGTKGGTLEHQQRQILLNVFILVLPSPSTQPPPSPSPNTFTPHCLTPPICRPAPFLCPSVTYRTMLSHSLSQYRPVSVRQAPWDRTVLMRVFDPKCQQFLSYPSCGLARWVLPADNGWYSICTLVFHILPRFENVSLPFVMDGIP